MALPAPEAAEGLTYDDALNELPAIYVGVERVDFRKQINRLAALVQELVAMDPLASSSSSSPTGAPTG